ncbi:cob(I)yrinic acid a,c-diamide adenosyltransferase [Nostoc sp. 3335mG]|nr:cob(I)yrinic acid a,c-diamide adenosyltransferase [Nostoc sp. 3335mG]
MGHRLSRIVTRTGDDGTTGLSDGSRRRKDDALIEAIGTVDELNSMVGFAESQQARPDLRAALIDIQHDLFDLGGGLSIPGHPVLSEAHVEALEQLAEGWNADLPPLRNFILPGGTPAVAALHMARTVCRRAERRLLSVGEGHLDTARIYLNRLSDLLFIAARVAAEGQDRLWQPRRRENS